MAPRPSSSNPASVASSPTASAALPFHGPTPQVPEKPSSTSPSVSSFLVKITVGFPRRATQNFHRAGTSAATTSLTASCGLSGSTSKATDPSTAHAFPPLPVNQIFTVGATFMDRWCAPSSAPAPATSESCTANESPTCVESREPPRTFTFHFLTGSDPLMVKPSATDAPAPPVPALTSEALTPANASMVMKGFSGLIHDRKRHSGMTTSVHFRLE